MRFCFDCCFGATGKSPWLSEQGGHSATNAVKVLTVVDFESKAKKAVKLYIFNHLFAKAALLSNPNIHFSAYF